MTAISFFRHLLGGGLACALVACSHGASTSASGTASASKPAPAASAWIGHGATACETYLTPSVVGEILKKADGRSKPLSSQGCTYETTDFSSINIMLTLGGVATLNAHMPYLSDVSPLAGVGDKAVRTATGIEAAKGTDRICGIDVMPPFAAKVSGDALAEKLGAICNQLLTLP
jgi:hypothetical protein